MSISLQKSSPASFVVNGPSKLVYFLQTLFYFTKSDFKTTVFPVVRFPSSYLSLSFVYSRFFRPSSPPLRLHTTPPLTFLLPLSGLGCTSYTSTSPTKLSTLTKTSSTRKTVLSPLAVSHYTMPRSFVGLLYLHAGLCRTTTVFRLSMRAWS